jgi:hypothetical protein
MNNIDVEIHDCLFSKELNFNHSSKEKRSIVIQIFCNLFFAYEEKEMKTKNLNMICSFVRKGLFPY